MDDIEKLLLDIEKQKVFMDAKKKRIDLIKDESEKKLEILEKRVKEAHDVWQFLAWKIPEVKEDRDRKIREVGYNSSYLKAYNKIKKLSKQIVISNDMLVELLNKETGNNWTIKLMQYTEPYKGGLIYNQTKLGLWAMRDASKESIILKDFSNILDVDEDRIISNDELKNKHISVIASTTSSMDDRHDIKHLKEMNWSLPYFIKKYLKTNNRPNFEISYNEDINDDYIGSLMYNAIDKYVTNLFATTSGENKTPTIKK